jgi:hypothetical protein
MSSPDDQNPYAPPRSLELGGPSAPRMPVVDTQTTVPKVFGVLSIIFASVTLLGGLLGSCSFLAAGAFGAMSSMGVDKEREMMAMLGPMKTIYNAFGFQSLIFIGMSVWLLVIGIGQLRYRAWAQRQSVAWGFAGIIGVVVVVAISLAVIGPAYRDMFNSIATLGLHGDKAPPQMPGGMGVMMGGSTSVLQIFLCAPYPILMLIMFTRDHVRAAMTT